MIRISLSYLCRLATQLEPLANLPTTPVTLAEVLSPLMSAQQALIDAHGAGSLYAPYLRSSTPFASVLLESIRSLIDIDNLNLSKDIPIFGCSNVKYQFDQYKIALLAELGSLNAYFVTKKGSHDTYTLLSSGEELFPNDLGTKVPEAVFDIKEAAKCLAFELPTACGFHTFRALESVVRKYYSHVTGGAATPKVRNLGVYINAIRQSGKGDARVLAALKQITDLHRNPLIHPEAVLGNEEAITILGIARSVAGTILAELPPVPQTTATVQIPVAAAAGTPA